VQNWPKLRDMCGIDPAAFTKDIEHPARIEDYEDPLDSSVPLPKETPDGPADTLTQTTGIILRDNDTSLPQRSQTVHVPVSNTADPPHLPPRTVTDHDLDKAELTSQLPRSIPFLASSTGMAPPPLPPRSVPSSAPSTQPGSAEEASFRRKPMPSVDVPPRYSTVVSQSPTESPSSYSTPADGFGPPRRGDWSLDSNEPTGDEPIRNTSNGSHFNPRGSVTRKPVSKDGGPLEPSQKS
jgi:Rho GTPase-activating protein 1